MAFNISFDIDNQVHPLRKAQIVYLKMDGALIEVLSKYTDFVDIFSLKLAIKFSKYLGINNHAIELIDY